MPDILAANWPWVAVVAGVLVLGWGQRGRVTGWLARLRPKPEPPAEPTVMERVEAYLLLTGWLNEYSDAYEVMKEKVLPVIMEEKVE